MKDYVKEALDLGAVNVVRFSIEDIVFDSRFVLKCIFGCGDFGKLHTCPYQRSPLSMNEYREIFQNYKWGIIIGCKDKHTSQEVSFEIEKMCFFDGYYFVFSLSDCGICKECAKGVSQDCRNPEKARPAFHSIGVDIFRTVRNFGLPIEVLKTKDDEQHWYSAVFIE
jgi:predicted metal-binding protein